MASIEELFCWLLRVSIGAQEPLSRLPKEAEWGELFDMAVKQSLVGVCFAGVKRCLERACKDDGFSLDEALTYLHIPSDLYYNWMGMAFQIEQRNAIVDAHCVELQESLAKIGVRSSILKGQGIAKLYDNELASLRQSGDIDIYVDCGRVKAIELARKIQDKVDWDIKHLHLKIFPDTAVEMHYRVENLMCPWRNRKLQKWFKEQEVASSMFLHTTGSGTCLSGEMVCPSVEFNIVYILLHAYRHAVTGGVGLRQLMDYYFVLKASQHVDRSTGLEIIESFGMKRFASGVMWIMAHVFANNDLNDNYLLGFEPNEKEGRFLLDEIMAGGNFGHYDTRYGEKGKGRLGTLCQIMKRNVSLFVHYPSEVFWTPWWYVKHFFWKRLQILKDK